MATPVPRVPNAMPAPSVSAAGDVDETIASPSGDGDASTGFEPEKGARNGDILKCDRHRSSSGSGGGK